MVTESFTLNTGARIPAVGLGCWMGSPGAFDLHKGMEIALKAGYRHFDTAALYGNEDVVGDSIRASDVPRSEVFVTTKLAIGRKDVQAAFDESLQKLNIDYIDLYLMHWPQVTDSFVDCWKQMENLLETRKGKVKAIGISNFSVKTMNELLPHCKVIPAVNQIESHPYLPEWDVVDLCKKHEIFVTAYTPLGQANSPILKDADIMRIAQETHSTPGQVTLSWNVQRGVGVLPKSTNETRAAQNIDLITLSEDQMDRINKISQDPTRFGRLNNIVYDPASDQVLGWSMEKMGWENTPYHRAV
ncbi:hypothetical protein MYAM1_003283 [Malassezia yamatoensis]|uniref:NADP-dependent oxidoreductase domain-containing protein n=1 Tax=Malassezia yamatoensis TaxID=253288 RepID=A0AAJ5YTN9_9BASI|nr:hypothetical protein MYAM1_003283 [Malassezia yamatoensis]